MQDHQRGPLSHSAGLGTEFTTYDVRARMVTRRGISRFSDSQGYPYLSYVTTHVTNLKWFMSISSLSLRNSNDFVCCKHGMSSESNKLKLQYQHLCARGVCDRARSPKLCTQPHPAITRILSTQQLPPRELHHPRGGAFADHARRPCRHSGGAATYLNTT
jgi:hypothetical protein